MFVADGKGNQNAVCKSNNNEADGRSANAICRKLKFTGGKVFKNGDNINCGDKDGEETEDKVIILFRNSVQKKIK